MLAVYAIKYSKNESLLFEKVKDRLNEVISMSNSDQEVIMGLLYVYCDNLKNEPFYQNLQNATEKMINQCTPVVFINFLRLCIQIHKNKENLFEERIYEEIKRKYRDLEKHYRDEEKLELKESFKYLGLDIGD